MASPDGIVNMETLLVLVEFHGDSEIGEKTRKMAKATTFITLPGTEISAVKDKLAGETPTPNHNGPRKKTLR